MNRFIPVFILIILVYSCKKNESDFAWNNSYGKGEAMFLSSTFDSGFVACGQIEGKPYLVRLNKNRNIIVDFDYDDPGLFSSTWCDTSGYITGGSTGGKMLLVRHSADGNKLWEKTFDPDFYVDYTKLNYTGNGSFLAIGTASPDSSESGATGLLYVRFDTTGLIISEKEITESAFISANDAVVDNSGNVFLALTRQTSGNKPKASVAKLNSGFQKIWEEEIYNNPDFGAASNAIISDGAGNLYVTGKTELSTKDGVLNNSFVTSLTSTKSVRWKRYLENSNTGAALVFDNNNNLMMLNINCFIINILSTTDGSDAGRIKMLGICDSYNTDAHGEDFCINYDKNVMVAGSCGGNFYLAMKSSQ